MPRIGADIVSSVQDLCEDVWLASCITILHNKHQDLYVFDLETSNGALLPALQRAYVLTGNGPSSCSTIGRLERVRSQQTPATNIMEGTTVCLCGCTSTLTSRQHIIHHLYTFVSVQKPAQQQQYPTLPQLRSERMPPPPWPHLSNPLTNHRRDQMAASQQKERFAHGVQVCSMVTNRKPTRYKQQTHISPLTSAGFQATVCYCILHPQFPSLYVGKLTWHTESPRLPCYTTKRSLAARGLGISSSH